MHDFAAQLAAVMPTALEGRVARLVGTTAAVAGFPAPVGATAEICRQGSEPLAAEVVGFRDELTLLYPLGDLTGVRHGDRVRLRHTNQWLPVGGELLGRVVNALGRPIDGGAPLRLGERATLFRPPLTPRGSFFHASADGQRFLFSVEPPQPDLTRYHVAVDWLKSQ